jgi:hypothetical protein
MSIAYELKRIGSRILPPGIKQSLKKIEKPFNKILVFYYAHKDFSHTNAQAFEYSFGVNWMKKGNFEESYAYWEQEKKEGMGSLAAYKRITADPPFFRNKAEFDDFCKKIDGKKSLEIGSSTDGILVNFPWLTQRILVDPLTAKYRAIQLKEWGKTFFTDDIKIYGQVAETTIPELIGKIDGSIICRNTLDHTADPWKILANISAYAAEGCTLLFWADIWHPKLNNAGHRNIMQDPNEFENKIKELGFDIVRTLPQNPIRHDVTIDYGCVAIKRL